jgi:hypothetical protein
LLGSYLHNCNYHYALDSPLFTVIAENKFLPLSIMWYPIDG